MITKMQAVGSIASTATIGAVVGHNIDDIVEKYNLETGRYPMVIEYRITNNCLSSHKEPMPYKIYYDKLEICICSLEKTELEYDYDSYKMDENKFFDIFAENTEECTDTRN